ncbi:hypothetical protein [Malaciobacter marinus]|uniref:PBECR3 domain-containing polyvalent protein n=1 Tax=Malaciobacter marinus TaxID=505249 RepID=UPI0009A8CAC3|nr:hypothetical protein [Malaciobacter marinus]SKB24742.1 hypothetical protein SAMN06295997_10140 [Malaciobacter marinus]
MRLEEFISIALNSNTRDIIYELEITEDACRAIKKHTNLNICKYKFIIQEEYVRHIRNGHKEHLYLLPKLPDILNNFTHVEKSIIRNRRGQIEVSLVFRKKFEDGVIRMIALRVIEDKVLSLKTFFRP